MWARQTARGETLCTCSLNLQWHAKKFEPFTMHAQRRRPKGLTLIPAHVEYALHANSAWVSELWRVAGSIRATMAQRRLKSDISFWLMRTPIECTVHTCMKACLPIVP